MLQLKENVIKNLTKILTSDKTNDVLFISLKLRR